MIWRFIDLGQSRLGVEPASDGRAGKTGNSLANYGYVYETNTNRLDKVNNNGTLLTDYTYNTIGQMVQQVDAAQR